MKSSLPVVVILTACGGGGSPGGAASFVANCTVAAPSADATAAAGAHAAQPAQGSLPATPAGWFQIGGRDVTPVGTVIPIGGYPLSVRPLPAPYSTHVVVSSAGLGDNYLVLADTSAAPASAVVSRVTYGLGQDDDRSPSLLFGLAVAQQGGVRVFASCGGQNLAPEGNTDPAQQANSIDSYQVTGTPPALTQGVHLRLPPGGHGLRYPTGLALSSDESTLYIAGQADGSLTLMNVTRGAGLGTLIGAVEGLGSFPYDVAIDETSKRAYLSLQGGVVQSTLPVLQVRDGLAAVDLSTPAKPSQVSDAALDMLLNTGRASEHLLVAGRQLLATAADGDRLTALNLDGLLMPLMTPAAPPATVDLSLPTSHARGRSPTGMAVDTARGRLYVASARDNAVWVLNLSDLMLLGRYPTAAYPTALTVLADGTLVVACARGSGSYPSSQLPTDDNPEAGVIQVIAPDEDFVRGDAVVQRNNSRPQRYALTPTCTGATPSFPLPLAPGGPSPIQHVFLVVRENKTYDDLLADQPGTRGEPDLLLFPANDTPNLHALAARFTNLDNFYANADQSIQGHLWTTAAFANEFTETTWFTTWGRNTHSESLFGGTTTVDYTTQGGSGSLFEAMDRAGISYHNYGEIVNSQSAKVGLDRDYPGVIFNLDTRDVDRAAYIVGRLNDASQTIERFHYLLLPDDHTYGTAAGKLTPDSMVADNDEGTGQLIDGLSRSPYWSSSVVFIIEDDPQDGVDHIDQHRSVCLMISPWARKGYVSHVNYDDASLWRTIELLVGLPPTNALTATAAPMYDLFIGAGEQPDLTPYSAIPRKVADKLNRADAVLAAESAAIDFSRPDTASLTRILWRAQKGREPPFGARPPRPREDDDD